MILLLIGLWLIFGILSFGIVGFHFASMYRLAKKPWKLKTDMSYSPRLSIIIPTYNEGGIIRLKLLNLARVDYPKSLLQFIVIDSNSDDGTFEIAKDFAAQHSGLDFLTLSFPQKGKTKALNFALEHATGDVIVVSDADCFYPRNILRGSLFYLSDPNVGAISGPKILLNAGSSDVANMESRYLRFMNLVKLGESKLGLTPLFEGGFSAYKREVLGSFDPYGTGSDDCGTILRLAEKSHNALFVPEAMFFTAFPTTWKARVGMKVRRANQLVRVFVNYLAMSLSKRVRTAKRVIYANIFIYLLSPIFFALFLFVTMLVLFYYPYFALFLLVFLIPKVGPMLIDLVQNYFVLLVGLLAVALDKRFIVWNKPADRYLLTEDILRRYDLI